MLTDWPLAFCSEQTKHPYTITATLKHKCWRFSITGFTECGWTTQTEDIWVYVHIYVHSGDAHTRIDFVFVYRIKAFLLLRLWPCLQQPSWQGSEQAPSESAAHHLSNTAIHLVHAVMYTRISTIKHNYSHSTMYVRILCPYNVRTCMSIQ